jgi:hypothetical protein
MNRDNAAACGRGKIRSRTSNTFARHTRPHHAQRRHCKQTGTADFRIVHLSRWALRQARVGEKEGAQVHRGSRRHDLGWEGASVTRQVGAAENRRASNADAPAASHTAARATNLGRRKTWGQVFAGTECAACLFMPTGIAVQTPSPDSWVRGAVSVLQIRAISEGEVFSMVGVQ